eukprot:971132-Lingulodinium_polyedra.AAC.1
MASMITPAAQSLNSGVPLVRHASKPLQNHCDDRPRRLRCNVERRGPHQCRDVLQTILGCALALA